MPSLHHNPTKLEVFVYLEESAESLSERAWISLLMNIACSSMLLDSKHFQNQLH